jgi:hypothetical protein
MPSDWKVRIDYGIGKTNRDRRGSRFRIFRIDNPLYSILQCK